MHGAIQKRNVQDKYFSKKGGVCRIRRGKLATKKSRYIIGNTVEFAKNNLQIDQRNKTSLFNGNNFTDIYNFKLR